MKSIQTKFAPEAFVPHDIFGDEMSHLQECETSDGCRCVVEVVYTMWLHDDFMVKSADRECRRLYRISFDKVLSLWKTRLGLGEIKYWHYIKMTRI